MPATAAAYYLNVLKTDPRNADLLSRTFLSVLTDGDIDEAGKLADRLVQVDHNRPHRAARDRRARAQAEAIRRGAAEFCAVGARPGDRSDGDAAVGLGAIGRRRYARSAIDTLDKLTGPDWYGIFKDLHAGLILDLANNKKNAAKRYERAYKADPTALRTVQAYGRFLSRNGSKDDALKVYQDFDKALPDHPLIKEEMKQISDGEKLPPLVESPQAGAAEALYGLGASIGRRGGEDLALIYLQLALYLEPSHTMALLSLADLYELLKKPELAIKVYERVPSTSSLAAQRRNPARRRSRSARPHRRSQEAARSRHCRASEGHRSDPCARQHPARAQGFCRLRRRLQQGDRHDRRRRKSRTG